MSERFWDKLNIITGIIAIGVVFGLTSFMASLEIKDLDLWLHLKMGQFISENRFVPSFDVLSCSIAGKPWVNHEWLFQVIVYQIVHGWGFNGLINMQIGVVFLTFLILLILGYNRNHQLLTAFSLLLILFVYQTRFTIRPDIFSLLFFVCFVWILAWFMNRRWSLAVIFALQVAWTNMHGFFFFGPLLVGLALASEFLKRHAPLPWQWKETSRLSDKAYLNIKILFPLVLLACCINPLTFKGAFYPIDVLMGMGSGSAKIFFAHITELQKPITASTIWSGQYGHYKALIIISFMSFFFNRRKIDISVLFIWILFLLFSLVAVRNMVFFAVAAYIALIANALSIDWQRIIPLGFYQKKFKLITCIFIKAFLIFWMVDNGTKIASNGYFDFDTFERKSEFRDVSKRAYPYHAVDFLVQNKIKGNFFNDFNSGAYLIGRCFPDIKVYMDGRTEQYGSEFFEHYQKIWKEGDAKVFLSDAEKYNITGAFLNNNNQMIPARVLRMFYGLSDWKMVYFDYDAVIFLKNTPSNKAWIDKFNIDLHKWQPPKFDLQRLGTKRLDPIPLTNRAYLLKTLGFYNKALRQSQAALKISPNDFEAYSLLGEIYRVKGEYQKSFENFRVAVTLSPSDTKMRLNLARSYEYLKDFQGAVYQYNRIIEIEPKNSKAHFGLARTFALSNQVDKALQYLDKAQKLDPKDKVDVKKIRDIIEKNKKQKVVQRK